MFQFQTEMSQMMNDLTAKVEGHEPPEGSKSEEKEKVEGEDETVTADTKTEEESGTEEKKEESIFKGVHDYLKLLIEDKKKYMLHTEPFFYKVKLILSNHLSCNE